MNRGPKKLLVVDDDDAFRESMEFEFTDRGYKVVLAATHREALGMAAVHRPQYAVVDLRLAGERGLEVLEDLVDRPIFSADLTLYWAIYRTLGIGPDGRGRGSLLDSLTGPDV